MKKIKSKHKRSPKPIQVRIKDIENIQTLVRNLVEEQVRFNFKEQAILRSTLSKNIKEIFNADYFCDCIVTRIKKALTDDFEALAAFAPYKDQFAIAGVDIKSLVKRVCEQWLLDRARSLNTILK